MAHRKATEGRRPTAPPEAGREARDGPDRGEYPSTQRKQRAQDGSPTEGQTLVSKPAGPRAPPVPQHRLSTQKRFSPWPASSR